MAGGVCADAIPIVATQAAPARIVSDFIGLILVCFLRPAQAKPLAPNTFVPQQGKEAVLYDILGICDRACLKCITRQPGKESLKYRGNPHIALPGSASRDKLRLVLLACSLVRRGRMAPI
ncbi:MAG: hypothetical protein ACRD4P_06275, partial [Bryobacteraceae bacterium]